MGGHTVILKLLVIIFATATVTSGSKCKQQCYNNNECSDLTCSYCNATDGNPGTCVAGFACGHPCVVDTDCDVFRGCDICVNNVCVVNPVGCAAPCKNDNGCSDPICTMCGAQGMCVPGFGCGSTCSVDYDCNTQSNCSFCVNQQCAAPCGMPCTRNHECTPSCPKCNNGLCIPLPPAEGETQGSNEHQHQRKEKETIRLRHKKIVPTN